MKHGHKKTEIKRTNRYVKYSNACSLAACFYFSTYAPVVERHEIFLTLLPLWINMENLPFNFFSETQDRYSRASTKEIQYQAIFLPHCLFVVLCYVVY